MLSLKPIFSVLPYRDVANRRNVFGCYPSNLSCACCRVAMLPPSLKPILCLLPYINVATLPQTYLVLVAVYQRCHPSSNLSCACCRMAMLPLARPSSQPSCLCRRIDVATAPYIRIISIEYATTRNRLPRLCVQTATVVCSDYTSL